MALFTTTECCQFVKSTSPVALGAGCTKAYLDSVGGDLTSVMGPGGEPAYSNAQAPLFSVRHNDQWAIEVREAAIVALCRVGLNAWHNNDLLECVYADEQRAVFTGISVPYPGETNRLGYTGFYAVGTEPGTGNTIVEVGDLTHMVAIAEYAFEKQPGPVCAVYQITHVDSELWQVTVNDGGALSGAEGYVAPYSFNADLTVGGAGSDLQSILDQMSSQYKSQWLFTNEGYSIGDQLVMTGYYAGIEENNARLYIVGYVDNAFDCLPTDQNYYTCQPPAVRYYKPAIEWARLDELGLAGAACRLPRFDGTNLINTQGAYGDAFFQLKEGLRSSIMVMGFAFKGFLNYTNRGMSIVYTGFSDGIGNAEYASVRHCAVLESEAGSVNVIGISLGEGIVAEMYDCYLAARDGFSVCPVLSAYDYNNGLEYNGFVEVSHCCLKRVTAIASRYNTCVFHHNIVKYWVNWPSVISIDGGTLRFNNIWYTDSTNLKGNLLFSMNATYGRMVSFNEIIVINTLNPEWKGLIYGYGGHLQADYNCFYEINGLPIEPIMDSRSRAQWNGYASIQEIGQHNIVADPMFVDPANWDFRLRPGSPCIGAGKPDGMGSPTHIGLHVEKQPLGLYGEPISIYGI